MKILYNTITSRIEGKPFNPPFEEVFNSAFSKVPGQLPIHIVQLNVVSTPLEVSSSEVLVKNEWVIDLGLNEYRLEQIKRDKTPEELAYEAAYKDWVHKEFRLRIVAPIQLILDDVGIKMYGWFNLNDLPITKPNPSQVHLYCNEILEDHSSVIDSLSGIVTVEERPLILNPTDISLIEPEELGLSKQTK